MADSVTVAYVHSHEVAHSWYASVLNVLLADLGNEGRLMAGGFVSVPYSTGGIAAARNDGVEAFLSKSSDWLWWVDTDMGFAPDTVERLLASADASERPVMGALCYRWMEEGHDGLNGYQCRPSPTIYEWFEAGDRAGFAVAEDFAVDKVVRCAGTGSACILVHRSVFERIAEAEGPEWYTPLRHPTMGVVGEDLSFCLRLGRHGIPLHVDTSVKTNHLKRLWVSDRTPSPAPMVAPQPNRAERRRMARQGVSDGTR